MIRSILLQPVRLPRCPSTLDEEIYFPNQELKNSPSIELDGDACFEQLIECSSKTLHLSLATAAINLFETEKIKFIGIVGTAAEYHNKLWVSQHPVMIRKGVIYLVIKGTLPPRQVFHRGQDEGNPVGDKLMAALYLLSSVIYIEASQEDRFEQSVQRVLKHSARPTKSLLLFVGEDVKYQPDGSESTQYTELSSNRSAKRDSKKTQDKPRNQLLYKNVNESQTEISSLNSLRRVKETLLKMLEKGPNSGKVHMNGTIKQMVWALNQNKIMDEDEIDRQCIELILEQSQERCLTQFDLITQIDTDNLRKMESTELRSLLRSATHEVSEAFFQETQFLSSCRMYEAYCNGLWHQLSEKREAMTRCFESLQKQYYLLKAEKVQYVASSEFQKWIGTQNLAGGQLLFSAYARQVKVNLPEILQELARKGLKKGAQAQQISDEAGLLANVEERIQNYQEEKKKIEEIIQLHEKDRQLLKAVKKHEEQLARNNQKKAMKPSESNSNNNEVSKDENKSSFQMKSIKINSPRHKSGIVAADGISIVYGPKKAQSGEREAVVRQVGFEGKRLSAIQPRQGKGQYPYSTVEPASGLAESRINIRI